MALNFLEAAKTKMEDIERAPLLPVGQYQLAVTQMPKTTTTSDNKWDIVEFLIRPVAWADDDTPAPEELAEFDLTKQRIRFAFLFDKEDEMSFANTMDDLKKFLEDTLGIEAKTMQEAISQTPNDTFQGWVGWRPDKNNPEKQYVEIKKHAPLG